VWSHPQLVAWAGLQLQNCPYSLDIALERFYTGETQKYSTLAHFTPVTTDLPPGLASTTPASIFAGKQLFFSGASQATTYKLFSLQFL
jgi:hypothetical protein